MQDELKTLIALLQRRSSRRLFSPEPIDPDILQLIRDNAILIPTAGGLRATHFRFTDDHGIIAECARAARQRFVEDAAALFCIYGDQNRMAIRYSRSMDKYLAMEAGHLAQNIYLLCEAAGLATCAVGAFSGQRVSRIFRLAPVEVPLYLMPIGCP